MYRRRRRSTRFVYYSKCSIEFMTRERNEGKEGGGFSGGKRDRDSQCYSGGIERNAFVWSRAERRSEGGRDPSVSPSPLSSSPLLLCSRIPKKTRKSRRKKYGKIENVPIPEDIPPLLAVTSTPPPQSHHPKRNEKPIFRRCLLTYFHNHHHGSKLLLWTVYWWWTWGKKESQSKMTTLKQNLPRREATCKVSSIVYTRARTHPHPRHEWREQLIIDSPHFTNKILEEGRKEFETQRILEEGKSDSPPHDPSINRSIVESVVFKMFSFLTMKYIPQTAF